jgi:hypothetical protein
MTLPLRALMLAALLVGCGPRNYRECMNEAANKPTPTGVQLAAIQCGRQYPDEMRAQQHGGYNPADRPVNPFDDLVPKKGSIDEFLAEEEKEQLPMWLLTIDNVIARLDAALGIPPAKDRGAHMLKRLVQLAVLLTVLGYVARKKPRK